MASLTHLERAVRALNFQDVDCVPLLGCNINQLEVLGIGDFEVPAEDEVRRRFIAAHHRLDIDALRQMVLPKVGATGLRDEHGRISNFRRHSESSFRSPEDVVRYIDSLPSLAEVRRTFDFRAEYEAYHHLMDDVQAECGDMLWIPGFKAGTCKFMLWYELFGYQPYLEAMALYKSKIADLFAHSAEEGRLINQVWAEATHKEGLLPFVYMGEDICGNLGPIASPKLLDEIYFPRLKYALEPLVEAGITVVWHSDGYIIPLVDRLIECGVGGFQGFQEETGFTIGDLAKKRAKNGKKVILWGSVSSFVVARGTVEDVKREVERSIDQGAPGGGFFLGPSSTLGPDSPAENVYTMYHYGREYGRKVMRG
ncbi:MAG: uroporphyrinogen decarboxylase family protein [Chloroflexota bacterium]